MNTLCRSKLNIVCKTQGNKKQNKKKSKYTTYKDLKLEMNRKKTNDNNKFNSLKTFFTNLFGEEIDYEKFNKESRFAIRIEEDKENKTKKW